MVHCPFNTNRFWIEKIPEKEVDIPPFLEAQRRQLLARAYIDQRMENKALNVLDKDETRNADLLRAEIYWKAQNAR